MTTELGWARAWKRAAWNWRHYAKATKKNYEDASERHFRAIEAQSEYGDYWRIQAEQEHAENVELHAALTQATARAEAVRDEANGWKARIDEVAYQRDRAVSERDSARDAQIKAQRAAKELRYEVSAIQDGQMLLQQYSKRLPDIRHVARMCGYAIAVHGSGQRDLDLIAAPWTTEARPATELAKEICSIVGGVIEEFENVERNPAQRPHGRLAWSIQIGAGRYIDLSVMPTAARDEAAERDRDEARATLDAMRQSYQQERAMWPEGETHDAWADLVKSERARAEHAQMERDCLCQCTACADPLHWPAAVLADGLYYHIAADDSDMVYCEAQLIRKMWAVGHPLAAALLPAVSGPASEETKR